MAKTKHIPDPKVLAVFDKMIAGVSGVERKGVQNPYVSINGNMFASMSQMDRIGLRLSKSDLVEFLDTFGGGLHEGVPGHFQKEYAAIPEGLYDDAESLQTWFCKSHAHASGLKAKPTKR